MLSFFLVVSKLYLIVMACILLFFLYQALPKIYTLVQEEKEWANQLLVVIIVAFYGVFGMIATVFWIGLVLAYFTNMAYVAWNFILQLTLLLLSIVLIVTITVALAKVFKKS